MIRIINKIKEMISIEEDRKSQSSSNRDQCILGGRIYAYQQVLNMLKPSSATIVPKFKRGDNVVFMRRVDDHTFYYNGTVESYTIIVDDTGTHVEYAIIDRIFSTQPQHREEDFVFDTFEEAKAKNDSLYTEIPK